MGHTHGTQGDMEPGGLVGAGWCGFGLAVVKNCSVGGMLGLWTRSILCVLLKVAMLLCRV